MDLTEAKYIKKRWQEYTEELYKKDGVITHLEPDILECEVKDMMLLKCCTQYVSKFGKLISGHRTRKGQFSVQSQIKALPKNAQGYGFSSGHVWM